MLSYFGFRTRQESFKKGRRVTQVKYFRKEVQKAIKREIKEIASDSDDYIDQKKMFKEWTKDPLYCSAGLREFPQILKRLGFKPSEWYKRRQQRLKRIRLP